MLVRLRYQVKRISLMSCFEVYVWENPVLKSQENMLAFSLSLENADFHFFVMFLA